MFLIDFPMFQCSLLMFFLTDVFSWFFLLLFFSCWCSNVSYFSIFSNTTITQTLVWTPSNNNQFNDNEGRTMFYDQCFSFHKLFWVYSSDSSEYIRLEGPEDPHLTNSRFLRSRDPAHASLPLAQTPWGLTGRAWLQAGAQQVAIVVSHN